MLATLPLLLALSAGTDAAAPSPAVLDAVQAQGVRHPQVFDIGKGVAIRQRFEQLAAVQRDALALSFYLVPKGRHAATDLDQVELGLDTGEDYLEVPLSRHARIELPAVPAALVDRAELFSNQPRRSLEIVYKIDIVADAADRLSVRHAQRALAQARPAWKAVLPGLARATVPKFNCVEFQFAGAGEVGLQASDGQKAPIGSGASVKVAIDALPAGAESLTWSGDLARIAACKA